MDGLCKQITIIDADSVSWDYITITELCVLQTHAALWFAGNEKLLTVEKFFKRRNENIGVKYRAIPAVP